MNFNYIGYPANGKIVNGTVSAASESVAADMLHSQGYQVLSLKPAASLKINWEKQFPSLFKVKTKTVVLFTRQLAMLLESGNDIITSLELLEKQATNRIFSRVLGEVILDLRRGKPLSTALSKYPDIFPNTYSRSLSAGEQTGGLDVMLRQIADYMEKELTARKSLKSALTYPVTVSVVAVVVVIILINFVMPTFVGLYKSMGAELPLPTTIFIGIVEIVRTYGIYMAAALAVTGLVIFSYIKTPKGRIKWDRLALTSPMVGKINLLNELAYCCRTMSMLFRSSVPLMEVMDIIILSSGNKVIQEALTDVKQATLKGEGLSKPMSKNPLFLPMMTQMVKIGEETGSLESSLSTVAQAYDAEATDNTQSLIGFIQPALTLAIGVVVALIAISMLSAMYAIYGQMSTK